MPETVKVMISSTARDLPEHRKQAMDACLRQGMFPTMMEYLPASDVDAIAASMAMVDKAEIYLGIFAHRYGYVPKENNPQQISVTEMEYNRAVERGIPCLIFLMHDDHPIKASEVETGDGAAKLKAFKGRVGTDRVRDTFVSPEDLRGKIIYALISYRKPDLTTFHYVSDIPTPPEPYIAHPYTLLQVRDLVGRNEETSLLSDWISNPETEIYEARIFNIVALGGEGKSALAWKWFTHIAPHKMWQCAGSMWWSFYESDAYFENYIVRALAYCARRPTEEIQAIPLPEREKQLLKILDNEPYLIVLDGLERILSAYSDTEAARLPDDELDEKTVNIVVGAVPVPVNIPHSFIGNHRLRKAVDPRAGAFLRRLASVRSSRILISTRLYPADLQTNTGQPISGSFAYFLNGLSDTDALELWYASGVTGSRETLLPLLRTFGKHALLIHALATEVAHYRHAPGDFDQWKRDHPDFDPFSLPLKQARSHVLRFALQGIDKTARKVLHTIAAFRMPVTYDTLTALLVGKAGLLVTLISGRGKLFANELSLVAVLSELEDRGLLGWDKRANRYDLHPIVRGVIWSGLDSDAKHGIYQELYAHFESIPPVNIEYVNRFEDLTVSLELYNTLIGLNRYEDAGRLFLDRLNKVTMHRLDASRQRAELLELLFPDGIDKPPRIEDPNFQAFILNNLGAAYGVSGYVKKAAQLFTRQIRTLTEASRRSGLVIAWFNLASALRQSGELRRAEAAGRFALALPRGENTSAFNYGLRELREQSLREEAIALHVLGLVLTARGVFNVATIALNRALRIFASLGDFQGEGAINADLAEQELWLGNPLAANRLAIRSWALAHIVRYESDLIRAKRLQGMAALGLKELSAADESLHYAIARAREVNFVEEELPALIGMAVLNREVGKRKTSRGLIEDICELSERGPYPLFHADSLNILAQIEGDKHNYEAAVKAAERAYRLAWCDGPPFAYHWGLEKARALLKELGAGEPEMPPFDASKFEPMPEVEIDPPDEFGAGNEAQAE